MTADLMLSPSGTRRVEEDYIMTLPPGEFTPTFRPISHGHLIQVLQKACLLNGLHTVGKTYSTNKGGTRMFGVWMFSAGEFGIKWSMGFRNSIDKSMAIGIVAGVTVFNCGNMTMSGEFIAFRKHTGGLSDEQLIKIATDAVGGAMVEMERLHQWQENLNHVWVPARHRQSFIYNLISKGVISPSEWEKYHNCLDLELQERRGRALDGTHSLFALHGAATRLLRDGNLLTTHKKMAMLNGVCDDYLLSRKAA